MKDKKLKIKELKLKSFKTSITYKDQSKIRGGACSLDTNCTGIYCRAISNDQTVCIA